MKFSRALSPVVTGFTLFASYHTALAQTSATLPAQPHEDPAKVDFYGAVEVRQTETQLTSQKKRETGQSTTSLTPSLGAIFWEKKIDTIFYGRYGISNEADGWVTFEAGNETLVDFYKNKILTMGAYSFTDFDPTTGLWASTDLGGNFAGEYAIPVAHGKYSFSAYTRPRGQFLSAKGRENNMITPINRTGRDNFGLDNAEDAQIFQRDPAVLIDSEVAIKFNPSAMSRLSFNLVLDLGQKWSPQYAAELDGGGSLDTTLDGYRLRQYTLTRPSVTYAVTDNIKVKAELRHYMGGVYGYTIDAATAAQDGELTKKSLESRVTVAADLF